MVMLSRPKLNILSDSQKKEIHNGTLDILENVGVKIEHKYVLDLLQSHNCLITNDNIVKIPAELVQNALKTVPKKLTLYNNIGEAVIFLENDNIYYGANIGSQFILDPFNNKCRKFKSNDSKYGAIICDNLKNIDFINDVGNPIDAPKEIADIVSFKQVITYSNKPVITNASTLVNSEIMFEMAAAAAGGYKELAAKPFVLRAASPISPLYLPEIEIERIIQTIKYEIPLIFCSITSSGANSPASILGTFLQINAEALSVLVIQQLLKNEAPFIYGGLASPLDMRRGLFPYGAPELPVFCSILSEMAHYYKLPILGTAGASDSSLVDVQAGSEVMLSSLFAGLSGAGLIHDIGMIEHGSVISPTLYVVADEIISMIKAALKNIDICKDTIKEIIGLIKKVGPLGNFLSEEHTLRHYKDFWYPGFFDRGNYHKDSIKINSIDSKVKKIIKDIIKNDKGIKISADRYKKIDKIVKQYRNSLTIS